MPRKRRMTESLESDEDIDDSKHPQRNAANARERARMRVLSKAFCRLKTTLPWVPADTKLSKLDTLRLATSYIAHLRAVLMDQPVSTGEQVHKHPLALMSFKFHYKKTTPSYEFKSRKKNHRDMKQLVTFVGAAAASAFNYYTDMVPKMFVLGGVPYGHKRLILGPSLFSAAIHQRMLATIGIYLGMNFPVSQSLGIRTYPISTNLFRSAYLTTLFIMGDPSTFNISSGCSLSQQI